MSAKAKLEHAGGSYRTISAMCVNLIIPLSTIRPAYRGPAELVG